MGFCLRFALLLVIVTVFNLAEQSSGASILPVVAVLASNSRPVGTVLAIGASSTGIAPDTPQYRFELAALGSTYKVVKDYSPDNFAEWTPLEEGPYQIRLTARNSR